MATIPDTALLGVGRCLRLQILDLSGCSNISEVGLSLLTAGGVGLKHLKSLNLWNCLRLPPTALRHLSSCTALQELSLRGCQLMDDEALRYIGALYSLQRLDLRACEHIRGGGGGGEVGGGSRNSGMTVLSSLTCLTELNLWGCYGLNDTGVSGIGVLKTLRVLKLNECWQLSNAGLQSLSTLTNVQCLDLSGCRNLVTTAGSSLAGLHAMTSLTCLILRGCDRLAGGALGFLRHHSTPSPAHTTPPSLSLPLPLPPLPLQSLDLSGCRELNAESLLPLGKSCASTLVSLRLQHCLGLKGPNALAGLEPLSFLTFLHLGGCTGLSGQSLMSLGSLGALRHLNIEGLINVPLLDKGLATVGWCCQSLTYLSLQGCNTLTDEGVAALGKLPALEMIVLSDCAAINGSGFSASTWSLSPVSVLQCQGATTLNDDGIKYIASNLSNLQELSLKHCRAVSDAGITSLGKSLSPTLTSLSLQGMVGLTDQGVASLAHLTSLESLELQFCWQFGDKGAMALTALTNLTSLDLMYCWKVTDEAVKVIGEMRALKSLNLMGCHRVTGQGKLAVARLLEDSMMRL